MRGICFIENCKDNMPKKMPLRLLNLEKQRGAFGVFWSYITTNYLF